jgi:alkanesulfonate monooxygenase SsuD/methylene tetrahydromethanopterin reductase-like flavin-dependent oxidoreductase (luciferase family)
VSRYDPAELPASLTGYVRKRQGYDYLHHAEVGSSNAAFVSDEIADRFSIIGDVADHVTKLRRLAEVGVDQFNLYLMNGDEEEQLEVYGRDVIPALRGVSAS